MGEATEECSWLWEQQAWRCRGGKKLVYFRNQAGLLSDAGKVRAGPARAGLGAGVCRPMCVLHIRTVELSEISAGPRVSGAPEGQA